jgi:parallel beta-helix repeat protein
MGCKIYVRASLTRWTVDDNGPADFSSIQEAINSPAVKDGDIIFVKAGTYDENVIVNKSVSLVGENRDLTIIDGNETGSVISITVNNVSIEVFTIKSGTQSDSGIFMDHSVGNDISRNIIKSNYYGISLNYSSNNMISDNTITNNGYGYRYGISITGSGDNTICCNNFNNTNQVSSDPDPTVTNVWDNGKEGNYWSDYAGQDLNGDGAGDSPYLIDNDQDNYPLMGTFAYFNVTLQEERHYVTTICNSTISEFRSKTGPETGNKIISFNVTGEDSTVGFCRVRIPTELMNYPYIVLVDVEEIVSTLLDVSNETYSYLYFTYVHSSHTITIISSKALYLYNKLQIDLYNLNTTYYDLLNNYSILLDNCSQLQESYRELNSSYQEHLLDYSENVHDIQNLMYIFAATTAIFIMTTIYLSKSAHAGKKGIRYKK